MPSNIWVLRHYVFNVLISRKDGHDFLSGIFENDILLKSMLSQLSASPKKSAELFKIRTEFMIIKSFLISVNVFKFNWIDFGLGFKNGGGSL